MDKYIQYGILEGLDVVEWVFSKGSIGESGDGGDGWTDGEKWEVLRMCLEKHVGRVMGMRRRVRAVDREDEAARAKRAAEKLESGEGVGEDEDVEPEGECLDLPCPRLPLIFVYCATSTSRTVHLCLAICTLLTVPRGEARAVQRSSRRPDIPRHSIGPLGKSPSGDLQTFHR